MSNKDFLPNINRWHCDYDCEAGDIAYKYQVPVNYTDNKPLLYWIDDDSYQTYYIESMQLNDEGPALMIVVNSEDKSIKQSVFEHKLRRVPYRFQRDGKLIDKEGFKCFAIKPDWEMCLYRHQDEQREMSIWDFDPCGDFAMQPNENNIYTINDCPTGETEKSFWDLIFLEKAFIDGKFNPKDSFDWDDVSAVGKEWKKIYKSDL